MKPDSRKRASDLYHRALHQPPDELPVFRGGVELIQLDVSVLDRNRQPVNGLSASDFTVIENGVERPIRAFEPITLPSRSPPVASARLETAPSDVATNWVGGEDGRLVIILMDRSIPPGQPTLAARNVAMTAVDALGPHDLAALVSTSGGVPQNLTSDRASLIAAIEQRDWSTGLSKEQEALVGKQDPLGDGRCLCGLCVHTFVPVVASVRAHARQGDLVMASADMAFGLGFDANLVDDVRLGYHSGRKPDVVVLDRRYKDTVAAMRTHEPAVVDHVRSTLDAYDRVLALDDYEVFVRPRDGVAGNSESRRQ